MASGSLPSGDWTTRKREPGFIRTCGEGKAPDRGPRRKKLSLGKDGEKEQAQTEK